MYFAAGKRLEGEKMDIPSSNVPTSEPPTAPMPVQPAPPPDEAPPSSVSSLSSLSLSSSQAVSEVLQIDPPPEPEPRCSVHLRNPSHRIHELQEGVGIASSRPSDPAVPRGVSIPGGFDADGEMAKLVDKLAGAWSVEAGLPLLHENWLGIEVALVAETSDSEALELHNLAEAKCRPNWPLWEHAIQEELDTLRTASTWTLEHAPPGANVIGSKWVFKAKKDALGKVV